MAMTVSELQVVVSADTSKAESGLSSLGSKVQSAGGHLATAFGAAAIGGIVAVGAGLAASVGAAANFESAMSAIKAVSGATSGEMEQLSSLALQLGADTSFSATEAAAGMGELIKAGVSVGDVMGGGAAGALSLAAAGAIEVKDAAELTSNALNAFGLEGSQAVHVADQIAGAANASAIDVSDFKFSLAAVGAVANTVGFSFEDTASAIALLGNAGIKGSDAGTSLKTMFLNLQPTTEKQIGLFRQLGLITADGANQFFDATGKVKGMSEVAGTLQTALAGMTQQQKLATLETIFGSDAIRAAAVFANEGAAGIDKMTDAIGKISAADVAKERLNNLQGSLEQLKGSLETAAIHLGTLLLPGLKSMTDGLTEGVNQGIEIIKRLPGAWEDVKAAFAGGVTAGGLTDLLSQLGLSDGAVETVIGTLGRLGDAWRTMTQALSGNWSPSSQIDPFINDVGRATLIVTSLGTEIDRLKESAGGLGGAIGGLSAQLGNGSNGLSLFGRVMGLLVLNVGQGIDVLTSLARIGLDVIRMVISVGQAIAAFAMGDMPAMNAALKGGDQAFADITGTMKEFGTNTVARTGEAMRLLGLTTDNSLTTMAASVESNMSAANAAVGEGSAGMQRFMEENMGAVAASAETGMATSTTAVETGAASMTSAMEAAGPSLAAAMDTGMVGVVAAVESNAPTAVAAAETMGAGMAAGIESAAPAMVSAAASGASGAVAAVEGQTGAASGAGSSLGAALGSGMEGGIMAYVGRVASAAAALVSAAIGAAHVEADARSPSKKTEKLGKDLADGLEIGLNSSKLGADMIAKIRDFIQASRDYIPTAGEIKRVEGEIKDIREKGQVEALFRAKEMITVDSEALRLKEDLVRKERDLLPLRRDLARASRDIADTERGTLETRQRMIEFSKTSAETNIKVNAIEREKIPLRARELEIERELLGLDAGSKRAKALKEEQDELHKKSSILDNAISQVRLQTRAEELNIAVIKDRQVVDSTAARIRQEGLTDNLRAQETQTQAIKDEIETLDAERAVFAANEAIIKNATDNEVAYRNRLIAVFTAEGKPMADRIKAGLALTEQLHKEGKISDELYNAIKKATEKTGEAAIATDTLGTAAKNVVSPMDAAAKKAQEMAAQAEAIAQQAKAAASKVDALSSSLGKLPDWFTATGSKSSGSLFESVFQFRASGGPVDAGMPYIVGEDGPELFMPNRSGTILPNVPSGGNGGGGLLERHEIAITIGGREAERIYVTGRDLAIRRGRA